MIKCSFCGEKKDTEKITNPNLDMCDDIDWFDKKNWWMVCIDCKNFIREKQRETFQMFLDEIKEKHTKSAETDLPSSTQGR